MDFFDQMKVYLDKGIDVSKDMFSKAGAAIQDFGDKSVTRIELHQLESKTKQEFARLGMQVYELFRAQNQLSISAEEPSIKNNMETIDHLRNEIEKRQDALQQNR